MQTFNIEALRASRMARRNLLLGVLFASPWLLGMILFIGYPLVASFYYSFTEYSVLSPVKAFVGLSNYTTLIFGDDEFRRSLYNSVYYALFSIPLGIIVSVGIALMLNMKIKGQAVYRTIYFLPVLIPDVAMAILWIWVFNAQFGIVNTLLWQLFRIMGPGWLASPVWSKPTVVLMSLWTVGQGVITYLAGLQDVPQALYDAAEVDGANAVQKTRHVTLPMITPVIFFNLIMGMIGSLQYFTIAYVITGGDGRPGQSLFFYAMYLYRNAFVYFKMGTASAMAWILFAVVLMGTLLVFRTSARWVYYGGEEAG
jgi:multiple sugar transport system permease protein